LGCKQASEQGGKKMSKELNLVDVPMAKKGGEQASKADDKGKSNNRDLD